MLTYSGWPLGLCEHKMNVFFTVVARRPKDTIWSGVILYINKIFFSVRMWFFFSTKMRNVPCCMAG